MLYCFIHADGDGRVTWAPEESLLKTETVQQHAIYWNKNDLQSCCDADLGTLLFQYKNDDCKHHSGLMSAICV